MTDESSDAGPVCALHARNPLSGFLAQHCADAEVTVIVRCVTADGTFSGYGVEANVCASHGEELERDYGAVRVPRPVVGAAQGG